MECVSNRRWELENMEVVDIVMAKNAKSGSKNAKEAERETCISVIEGNIVWSLLLWHIYSLFFVVPIGGRRSSADGNNNDLLMFVVLK